MTGRIQTDVLIIGGGPAGATSAMRLLELGITPLIVERQEFPRYHIGESMTSECGQVIRSLGLESRMIEAGHPVKHGVNVFGTRGNNDWWIPVAQRTPDLKLHDNTTWQVRRSEFDTMMLDEATSRGAERLQGRAIKPIMSDDGSTLVGVTVRTEDGSTVDIEAKVTLDCSGQATFLANQGVTGPKYLGAYDKQIAHFSQVANFERGDGSDRKSQPGNTNIFYREKYQWAWAIPIDDEVTSIGVVTPSQYFKDKKESKEAFLRREYKELNPGLSDRVNSTEFVEDVHVIPNYSFQVRKFAGPGYICVGDSHRFVDPIFSFGMFIAVTEAGYAANAVAKHLGGERAETANPFEDYMIEIERATDILEDTLDTFWENPLAFAVFVHNRYHDAMIDVFAGRIYDGMIVGDRDTAIAAFRRLLGRERTYDEGGLYSVPIGSRYHPERAPLWNSELDSVETTEEWIRAQ